MSDLIKAELVYDGGYTVFVPPDLGSARFDQMRGTPLEQLCELAGRCCYDSLGEGRPSFDDVHNGKPRQGYHTHIREVKHGSVWEHAPITIEISGEITPANVAMACINRPGVLCLLDATATARITLNLRAIAEWRTWSQIFPVAVPASNVLTALGAELAHIGHAAAPNIIPELETARPNGNWITGRVVEPVYDCEKWITLFMTGSRGMSHELVRHGDFTAISQRSTRFCDEDGTPWVEHPLITAWEEGRLQGHADELIESFAYLNPARPVAAEQYRYCVATLQPWLQSKGVDATSARKQARGAARGYLGNALLTEVVFSASVWQWKNMLRQRATRFADAEIREDFVKALPSLQKSRYGDCFGDWVLINSPDGIGQIAVETSEDE